MWTRKELKEKAKARFMPNYWRCVLVALIFTVITGGSVLSSSGRGNGGDYGYEDIRVEEMDLDALVDLDEKNFVTDIGGLKNFVGDIGGFLEHEMKVNGISRQDFAVIIPILLAAVTGVVLIVAAIAFLVQVFLLNPLSVGCSRFFVRNLSDTAQVKEICYGFDNHYMNHVKIMFFRSLYTFLWTLLFVIPGIVKSYEYQMVPYILTENPDITKEDAFALSKRMMDGNKWNAFVLDLSFLGWQILSGITFGILGIFYVEPYVCQTGAALYETLKNRQFTA